MPATNNTWLLGGDLEVFRLGFGAMRITGPGIWGEPQDPAEARRVQAGPGVLAHDVTIGRD